jgi:putative peptidoglycan lipid II flippase
METEIKAEPGSDGTTGTMREKHRIAKAAGIVSASTLLSRILGFIRDMIVAQYFGAGMSTDAFFVAFRIPNLLRRLVGEGSLTVSFIPVYSEYLHQRPQKESDELVRASFSVLLVVLAGITILGIVASPWIVKIIAHGFIQESEKFQLTVLLNRLMFPYIFFIGLVAWAMGILNTWRHFAAPALAPVFLNLAIILCALWLSPKLSSPILSLAYGVLLGGILQLLFQIPFLYRKKVSFRFFFKPAHPGVRRIVALMGPSVLGLAVTQLNVIVNTLLASYLPEGSISYLYYADRLLEFPMGIFAIAIATAVLPSLSAQAAKRELQGLKETISFSLGLVFFVTLPAMVGLIVLRVPILNLLFQRGSFGMTETAMTAQALFYYSLGLVGFAGVRIIVPVFYALQDMRTPVKVALVSLMANAGLGVLLMIPLRHGGLALAASLAAGLNFVLLIYLLKKKIGCIGSSKIFPSFLKSLVSSGIMGLVIFAAIHGEDPWRTSGVTGEKIGLLLAGLVLGVLIYGLSCYICKSEELRSIMEMIRKKPDPKGG